MPRIVDHDLRRREIVDALLAIAARDGLRAATSRAIAAELGMATGALWHYFVNFDALLSAAFAAVLSRTNNRIEKATAGTSGLIALHATMREILPTVHETELEARVVVDFWGRVALDDSLASQHLDHEHAWRLRLAQHISEAITSGDLVADTPVDDVVDLLLVLATGQQVASVLGASRGRADLQTSLVESLLAPYLPTPVAAQ